MSSASLAKRLDIAESTRGFGTFSPNNTTPGFKNPSQLAWVGHAGSASVL
jgi:hypothetical protein|eukprot:COSAG06_NODE_4624_length_4091_cov_2.704409_5_plen_50_part_00